MPNSKCHEKLARASLLRRASHEALRNAPRVSHQYLQQIVTYMHKVSQQYPSSHILIKSKITYDLPSVVATSIVVGKVFAATMRPEA